MLLLWHVVGRGIGSVLGSAENWNSDADSAGEMTFPRNILLPNIPIPNFLHILRDCHGQAD